MVEGWAINDDRIMVAAAVALKRYAQREKFILESIEADERTIYLDDDEKRQLASRLMRRLVELS